MTGDEYTTTQEQLKLLCAFIFDMDLKGCLEAIGRCETIAPLFNPTLYMQGSSRLQIVGKLTIAAYKFQKVVKECQAELAALPPVYDPMKDHGNLARLFGLPGEGEPGYDDES